MAGARRAASARPRTFPSHPDTWEGWEDSAVGPDRLGDYLRDLEKLFEEFGYADDAEPSLYGHFGQGCVHTRIPFGLTSTDGVANYRRFMERAARLVASYGGSFSGEHGDGQSRGELLPIMFGDVIMRAFSRAEGDLRSREQDEPRQGRRACTARRAPTTRRRLGSPSQRRARTSAIPTTTTRS